jgi:hypothetical protein
MYGVPETEFTSVDSVTVANMPPDVGCFTEIDCRSNPFGDLSRRFRFLANDESAHFQRRQTSTIAESAGAVTN